jgi:PA domain
MLVDRGPTEPGAEACKFAQKVYNAQQAGARGVVVVNYEDKLTTMEAPDEDDEVSYRYLQNISIPATFIAKSSGEALKSLIKSSGAASKVYVSLDWTDALPKQKQVEWEFWTNSNDQCGPICDVQRDFIKAFVPIAKEFDGAGWTIFSPHYIVWTCPGSYKESAECQSQCIHHGRYCAPDPDGSIKEGYSGAEVVQENLRQLCLYKLANATGKPYLWWDYVTLFADKCTMDSKAYGQTCAEEVFNQLNKDNWANIDDLRRCIGNIDDDTPHTIMEEQLTAQAGDGQEGEVFILPTLRINGAQYRGKLAVGEVLRALCAGFEEGNRPGACDRAIDDACMPGGKGFNECSANKDGKTQCIATFSGFSCTCGQGFISHKEDDGSESCLDINECLSITQLDPKCTCERCGCKNTYGGYE